MKQKNLYVDNQKLHEELSKYVRERQLAVSENRTIPKLPDYIARCIIAICDGLALAPNFARYPFVDEMKSDGIQNNIEYIHNYDPDKYSNPFTYITQIAYWAYVRRIQKEKRYLYSKLRYSQHTILLERQLVDADDHGINVMAADLTDWATQFTTDYEESQKKSKAKAKDKKVVSS